MNNDRKRKTIENRRSGHGRKKHNKTNVYDNGKQ